MTKLPRDADVELLETGPRDAKVTLVLAHGAGAGMDTPFLERVAEGLVAEGAAAGGVRVVRFEFPYMAEARRTGKRRGPDRMPALEDAFRAAVTKVVDAAPAQGTSVFLGGKSMGGRVATRIADELGKSKGVRGVVVFGYPFHPPSKPASLRVEHLEPLRTPTLILQGTRDPFGKPDEVATYPLSKAIEMVFVEDGDHSFEPRVSSGRTLDDNMRFALARATAFLLRHA